VYIVDRIDSFVAFSRTTNESVFSLLYGSCDCEHGTTRIFLLTAELLCAVQQSVDISYLPGLQQQIRHTLLQRANGTDEQTDGRTDGRRTVL